MNALWGFLNFHHQRVIPMTEIVTSVNVSINGSRCGCFSYLRILFYGLCFMLDYHNSVFSAGVLYLKGSCGTRQTLVCNTDDPVVR